MIKAETKRPRLLIFEAPAPLYEVAEAYIRRLATAAVAARGRFLLVLAGGGTPQPLYRRLAQADPDAPLPWEQTHVFWGDERMVPPDHPESNFGQAHSLLLSRVPIRPEQIYRIHGEEDPVTAAEKYAQTLLEVAEATAAEQGAAWPRFDLVLLGLGSDGHTASLFPGSTFPLPDAQPTQAVLAKYGDRPAGRVSLSPQVFNSARQILFLVTGEEKAEALAAVLEGEQAPIQWPAQRIQPGEGTLTWLADEAAARLLDIEPNVSVHATTKR